MKLLTITLFAGSILLAQAPATSKQPGLNQPGINNPGPIPQSTEKLAANGEGSGTRKGSQTRRSKAKKVRKADDAKKADK